MIQEGIGECSDSDKDYQLKFPSEMGGWVCWDLKAQMLLGERLQQCEQDGKLPKNDQTWIDMLTLTCPDDGILDMYICTNQSGSHKIKSKLDWCRL